MRERYLREVRAIVGDETSYLLSGRRKPPLQRLVVSMQCFVLFLQRFEPGDELLDGSIGLCLLHLFAFPL